LLQSHDHLNIKRIPEWIDQVTVEIEGEVRFPGTYPIARGESLSSVLERAGGLSQHASPDAAIFLRDSLRQKEGIHLQKLAKRLETDLEATLLEKIADTQRPAEGLTIANEMLEQLRSIEPVGRLVINLPGLLEDMSEERPSKFDIAMENGDRILIPSFSQEVSVVGEVFQSTSHLYHPDMDIEDYISASGGYTRKADQRNTYVIHPNGAASGSRGSTASSYSGQSGHPGSRKRTAWFGGGVAVRPGDTIVIPLNAEKVPTLDLWTDISQIIFNVGITAAAIENLLD
jgi:protein involved in polysaccharide export with SLBB domain